VRWAGERAFLVELSSLAEAMSLHARMVADPLGQIDQIAAARTVLLSFATARAARRAAARVVDIDLAPRPATKRRTVDIEVVYDGEDLDLVAEITGLGREAVVAAHQATPWTAAFGGFAPGFAYLIGGDPRLRVPRRDHPRTAVPAGSVALAGEFSAVYPRRSPGGWRLIGRTDAPLWDPSREDPALIAPGDRVRFRAVRDRVATRGEGFVENVPDGGGTEPGDLAGASVPALTVVEPGLLTLIEDLGRPGYADLGVTASGAADTQSARAANRLVGNSRRAAVLETLGGLAFRAEIDVVLALTGSDPWAEIRRRGAGAPDPAATADAAAAAERVDPDCADPVAAPFGPRRGFGRIYPCAAGSRRPRRSAVAPATSSVRWGRLRSGREPGWRSGRRRRARSRIRERSRRSPPRGPSSREARRPRTARHRRRPYPHHRPPCGSGSARGTTCSTRASAPTSPEPSGSSARTPTGSAPGSLRPTGPARSARPRAISRARAS
jgi:KipI family sensor histidine kinase inhibitor